MSGVSDSGKKNHGLDEGGEALGAVQLPQSLVAAVDAWAEARHIERSEAVRQLVELGLKVAPVSTSNHAIKSEAFQIEDEAISRIRGLLDPSLSAEERERRIRRLVEGPPEFSEQRIDLPRHKK
jgi:Ribbon-helix-helix protein, copG family